MAYRPPNVHFSTSAQSAQSKFSGLSWQLPQPWKLCQSWFQKWWRRNGPAHFHARCPLDMRLCPSSIHARLWPHHRQAILHRCRLVCGAQSLQSGGANEFLTTELRAGSKTEWLRKDLHVVLVNPQIPQNTGTIARTCAATGVGLHLVGPLGFEIDSTRLKRAGLDYWPYVAVNVHSTWQEFYEHFQGVEGPKRLLGFSKAGQKHYATPGLYREGDWLLFGAETTGLPDQAYASIHESSGEVLRIPITETHVRSLNVAVSAGVALYEAIRQLDGPH